MKTPMFRTRHCKQWIISLAIAMELFPTSGISMPDVILDFRGERGTACPEHLVARLGATHAARSLLDLWVKEAVVSEPRATKTQLVSKPLGGFPAIRAVRLRNKDVVGISVNWALLLSTPGAHAIFQELVKVSPKLAMLEVTGFPFLEMRGEDVEVSRSIFQFLRPKLHVLEFVSSNFPYIASRLYEKGIRFFLDCFSATAREKESLARAKQRPFVPVASRSIPKGWEIEMVAPQPEFPPPPLSHLGFCDAGLDYQAILALRDQGDFPFLVSLVVHEWAKAENAFYAAWMLRQMPGSKGYPNLRETSVESSSRFWGTLPVQQ